MRHATGWIAAAGLAAGASGQTATWINPAGGEWFDPANWAGGVAPLQGSGSVRFDLDAAYEILMPREFVGRRLAVDRGEVTVRRHNVGEIIGLIFNESEPANPPSIVVGQAGGAAVLRTDAPIRSQLVVIGGAGDGLFETSSALAVSDLVIGGVAESTDVRGELRLTGPDASLGAPGQTPAPSARIGLDGHGVLSLSGGATGSIGSLRLAIGPLSRAEVLLEGAQTRLDVLDLDSVEGDWIITIRDGATLAFPDGLFLSSRVGSRKIRLDGGSLLGLDVIHRSAGTLDIELSNRSVLVIGANAEVREIAIGAGARIQTRQLVASGGLRVTDGGVVEIGPGPFFGAVTLDVWGGVTIDGGRVVIDDGSDSPQLQPRLARLGRNAFDETNRSVRITGGATVDVEGALSILFFDDSEVRASVVRQRPQPVLTGLSDPPVAPAGGLQIVGLRGHGPERPDPVMTIDDGATVEATTIQLGGTILVGDASLTAEDIFIVERGALVVAPESLIQTPALALGRDVKYIVPEPDLDSSLRGAGTITGDVSNGAIVDPGAAGAPGALSVAGSFRQRLHSVPLPASFPFGFGPRLLALGLLHIDIASPTTHDSLEVTGEALLGGTLRAAFLDGFAPAWGDSFTFLTAGLIDGEFETLDLPEAPSGLVFEVDYTDTTATLVVHRRSDLTRDFKVGSADLGLLLGLWGSSDARADLNGDGLVGGADLGLLLGEWGLEAN